MCGCKIGSTVKRNRSKSVTITMEDMFFGALGVAVGMGANRGINEVLKSQSQEVKDTVGTALPVVKVGGSAYIATRKKMDRRAKWFAVGVGLQGASELVLRYAPEGYVQVSGVDGDVFNYLGDTTVRIPINPGASDGLPAGTEAAFEEEGILGTDDVYEEMGAVQEMI